MQDTDFGRLKRGWETSVLAHFITIAAECQEKAKICLRKNKTWTHLRPSIKESLKNPWETNQKMPEEFEFSHKKEAH